MMGWGWGWGVGLTFFFSLTQVQLRLTVKSLCQLALVTAKQLIFDNVLTTVNHRIAFQMEDVMKVWEYVREVKGRIGVSQGERDQCHLVPLRHEYC